MKKISFYIIVLYTALYLSGCNYHDEQKQLNEIHFVVAAEYPPFEYSDHGKLKGFDIDLARLIAKQLGKKAIFENKQFSTLLPSLTTGQADAAISTITITKARQKNFDFSTPYYFDGMVAVFRENQSIKTIKNKSQLTEKKLSAQLGSVMEIWLRAHYPKEEIIAMDNNNQAIEALIAGHVDVVVMDASQGPIFSQKYPGLTYAFLTQANDGYGIALKKNSPLTHQINKALDTLLANGSIEQLQKTWLGNTKEAQHGKKYVN